MLPINPPLTRSLLTIQSSVLSSVKRATLILFHVDKQPLIQKTQIISCVKKTFGMNGRLIHVIYPSSYKSLCCTCHYHQEEEEEEANIVNRQITTGQQEMNGIVILNE